MRSIKRLTTGALTVVAVTLMVMTATSPTYAGSTGTIVDADGVDYDAGCQLSLATTPPPANSIASPSGTGCPGVSLYDGSTETTDLRSVTLESTGTSGLSVKATFVVDGAVPTAGSTNINEGDGPAPGYNGNGYRALFQNKDRQNLTDDLAGGCTRTTGGREDDLHSPWEHGYHFYVSYSVEWDGVRWVHRARVGEYSPAIDGGFGFIDLGSTNALGIWTDADPAMAGRWSASVSGTGPTTVTVEYTGVILESDARCAGGVYGNAHVTPGDRIANVKAISTTDLSTEAGGFVFYSDVTEGNSVPGALGANISGISYTGGAIGFTDSIAVTNSCPTLCASVDDGSTTGHALLSEFWDTNYGFIA